MNLILNKYLLAGDKFMPEMHLKQPGFTYSACRPIKKKRQLADELHKPIIRKLKKKSAFFF